MAHNRSFATVPESRRCALVFLLIGVAIAAVGCGSTAQSQVTRLQTEKKELLNRIVDEQKRSETLTAELRDANLRAADAEKQLARLVDDSRGRLAGGGGGSTSPFAAAARSTVSANAGAAEFDSLPPVRPPIGLGAPRDSNRDYRSASDVPSPLRTSPKTLSSGPADVSDGIGIDLSGPRNGAVSPGWVPKSR